MGAEKAGNKDGTIGAVAAALACGMLVAAPTAAFQDVLDVPAMASELAAKGLINGLAQTGARGVGVG